MAADLGEYKALFPIPTVKKPDIFFWNEDRKIVNLVELTVPHEDNMNAAADRKDERYRTLLEELEEAGWDATHYPIEVGCRGFIGHRTRKWLVSIGQQQRQVSAVMKELQATVEKASHWIWLKRDDESWLEG